MRPGCWQQISQLHVLPPPDLRKKNPRDCGGSWANKYLPASVCRNHDATGLSVVHEDDTTTVLTPSIKGVGSRREGTVAGMTPSMAADGIAGGKKADSDWKRLSPTRHLVSPSVAATPAYKSTTVSMS